MAGVVAYHLWPNAIRGGYLGVSVFFVLSGFLITGRLLAEHERTGAVSLMSFYDRRFRRLLPAASLVVLGVVVVVIATGQRTVLSAGDVRAAVFWHYNWHELARHFEYGGVAPSALGHYWSLAIEEQFYFVFPVIAASALRWGGRRALAVAVSVLAAAGLVMSIAFDSYFNSLGRMSEIAFGCVLAVFGWTIARAEVAHRITSAALVILLTAFVFVDLPTRNELPNVAIICTVAATLLCITAAGSQHPMLVSAPLVVLGRYSYSVYLVHWPVIVLVDGLATQLVLTAVLSAASYHLVEAPIRFAKEVTPDEDLHRPHHDLVVVVGSSSDRIHP